MFVVPEPSERRTGVIARSGMVRSGFSATRRESFQRVISPRLIFRTPRRGWTVVTYWPLQQGGGHGSGSGRVGHQDDRLAGPGLSVPAPPGGGRDPGRLDHDGETARRADWAD